MAYVKISPLHRLVVNDDILYRQLTNLATEQNIIQVVVPSVTLYRGKTGTAKVVEELIVRLGVPEGIYNSC